MYRWCKNLDKEEEECLVWKEAIDGGKYLPGVGIDGINYESPKDRALKDKALKDYSYMKPGRCHMIYAVCSCLFIPSVVMRSIRPSVTRLVKSGN